MSMFNVLSLFAARLILVAIIMEGTYILPKRRKLRSLALFLKTILDIKNAEGMLQKYPLGHRGFVRPSHCEIDSCRHVEICYLGWRKLSITFPSSQFRAGQWRKGGRGVRKMFLIALQDRFIDAMHKRLAPARLSFLDCWEELWVRIRRGGLNCLSF